MDQIELEQILDKGEGTRIEFKEAQNGVPSTLYCTICSFLNCEGGVIILGVQDDGSALGLETQSIKKLKKDIVTALNNPDILNPTVIFP